MKFYVIVSEKCDTCEAFLKEKLQYCKETWKDVEWNVLTVEKELAEGRMPFPPQLVPAIYMYKDESKSHMPLFGEAFNVEPEFTTEINKAIEILQEVN